MALLIPEVRQQWTMGILAGISAIINFALFYSWFKKNVIISVLGAVIVSYAVIMLGENIFYYTFIYISSSKPGVSA
ncbi:hypothetical protein [Clostridium thermarum]|uniref:hypothetical protein n=1 Tax=Clostridium thermarum TaxID=1716543 RepID=UPI0013D0FEA7|nr:hypothetical protein [Clostridium thermarum]